MKPTWEDMRAVCIRNKSQALEYLGKEIWFLRAEDIDTSGRGYYWPRFMRVDDVYAREFVDHEQGSDVEFKKIVRLLVVKSQDKE